MPNHGWQLHRRMGMSGGLFKRAVMPGARAALAPEMSRNSPCRAAGAGVRPVSIPQIGPA